MSSKFIDNADWKTCSSHVSWRNSCSSLCHISKEHESHKNELKICGPVHISVCDKYIQNDEELSAKIFKILFSISVCVFKREGEDGTSVKKVVK